VVATIALVWGDQSVSLPLRCRIEQGLPTLVHLPRQPGARSSHAKLVALFADCTLCRRQHDGRNIKRQFLARVALRHSGPLADPDALSVVAGPAKSARVMGVPGACSSRLSEVTKPPSVVTSMQQFLQCIVQVD
jgi:hypothetical protein